MCIRDSRVRLPAISVHQLVGAGDVLRQAAGQPLHHFLLVAQVGGDLQPGRRAAAGQQQHGEHGRQAVSYTHLDVYKRQNHGYLAGHHEFCPKCDAELLAKQASCCTPA